MSCWRKENVLIYLKFDMQNKKEFLEEVVKICENCQKRKTLTTKTSEVIKTPEPMNIFETTHFYLCGSFKSLRNARKFILSIID